MDGRRGVEGSKTRGRSLKLALLGLLPEYYHEEEGQAFLMGVGGGDAAQREFDNPMERLRSASSGTRKMCDTSLNNRLSNLF